MVKYRVFQSRRLNAIVFLVGFSLGGLLFSYPNRNNKLETGLPAMERTMLQPSSSSTNTNTKPLPRGVLSTICDTQDPPNPVQYWQEMEDTKALYHALESRRTEHNGNDGVTFTCGTDTNFHVPFPPPNTLLAIHQAAAVWCALALESKRLGEGGRPANLLVWGLGNDSPFWAQSTKGRVVFLENNRGWFKQMTTKYPHLEAYMVNYPTNLKRDMKRLDDSDFVATVNDLLPPELKKKDSQLHNLQHNLQQWDVILADAPNGCRSNDVGRFGAIYTSKSIVDAQGGHGHLFVDDFNRKPEQIITNHVVVAAVSSSSRGGEGNENGKGGGCRQNCGEKVAVWNRIHPESGLYIEKTALFSFGESKNDAAAIVKIDGAIQ